MRLLQNSPIRTAVPLVTRFGNSASIASYKGASAGALLLRIANFYCFTSSASIMASSLVNGSSSQHDVVLKTFRLLIADLCQQFGGGHPG